MHEKIGVKAKYKSSIIYDVILAIISFAFIVTNFIEVIILTNYEVYRAICILKEVVFLIL